MKYLLLLFVFSLVILKINPSKQVHSNKNHTFCHTVLLKASLKNQDGQETQKARKISHGKRHRATKTRRKTRRKNKPLKKRRSRKQSIRTKVASSRQGIVFNGGACDFVDFGAVRNSGSSCNDGSKMVLKNS